MWTKICWNVVSILTKDENIPEANSSKDNEMPKFTVLDDYEEMMTGRQEELKSLKDMGTMTVVKRSEAVGKRTIQTRWVDREKDGRVKSRLVLKDYNRCQGRTPPRDVFTNTVDVVSENDVGCELTSQFRLTCTQHSCTRMSIRTCLHNRQSQMSGMMQD